jgi:hypothetical protein
MGMALNARFVITGVSFKKGSEEFAGCVRIKEVFFIV